MTRPKFSPATVAADIMSRCIGHRVLMAFHRLQHPDDVRYFDVMGPPAPPPLASDHSYARLVIEAATGLRPREDAGPPPTPPGHESPLIHYLEWLAEYGEP